jgi:eukaryotic-like serine/threonine-protein kinase
MTMTPQRWKDVKELFHAALERDADERGAFLANACADDHALRAEIESLIASYQQTGQFIDSPAYEQAAELIVGDKVDLKAGQVFGAYRIVSFIGRGGMGEIYLAEDTRLGRKVALKFLSPAFVNDADRLRRFEQEARAASALNQPSILTIYEIGEHESHRYIATEFVDGSTLRQLMPQQRFTLREALDVAEQIAAALDAAHAAGIVHRDIKPENVMLRADGIVKVLDFGLAKLTAPSKKTGSEVPTRQVITSQVGQVLGTVAYMSPEQARGLLVDGRTDIWSLGVVLYEMIAEKRPFDGETPSDVLVSVLEREPPTMDIVALGIPETLEFIISKALTKEREGRYQSAHEFLTDIRRLKQRLNVDGELERRGSTQLFSATAETSQSGTGAHKPTQEVPALATQQFSGSVAPRLRNNWLPISAIGLLVIGIIIGSYAWFGSRSKKVSLPATEILRTTQVATRTGMESSALSPDGNSIAYAAQPGDGAAEIFLKPLTPGAREIQLTFDGGQNAEPAWSRDGKWIAYRSGHRGGIWVIPSTGGTARQLTNFGATPSWSADGSLIAFQSEPGIMPPATIWKVSSQGGDPVQLTQPGTPEGGHSVPAWSPDGKRVTFAAYEGYTTGKLWSVDANGSDLRRVVKNDSIWFKGAVYSPDGASIYSGGVTEAGAFVIYQIPISQTGEATAEPSIIKDAGLAYVGDSPTISADGKKVLYSTEIPSGDLMSLPISPTSHESIGEPKPLVQSSGYRKSLASFSRDGRKIAYLQFSAGQNQQVWVMDADGTNARQLTAGPEVNWSCSWLSDNDTIVFLSQKKTGQEVRTFSVSSGREKMLFKPIVEMGWARVSPDGQQVAFNSARGETMNTWTIPITGGAPRQITFDHESIAWPCWSPDGKTLAVQLKRGRNTYLAIMPSSGGEVTQLTFEDGLVFLHDWSPDGDKIVFAGRRKGIWNVYWYSLSTKEQKQLTHYTSRSHYVRYPTWSPRGDQIVYEYSEAAGQIWLMEMK